MKAQDEQKKLGLIIIGAIVGLFLMGAVTGYFISRVKFNHSVQNVEIQPIDTLHSEIKPRLATGD